MTKKINLSMIVGTAFFIAGFASGYLTSYYQEYADESEMINNSRVFIKNKGKRAAEQAAVSISKEEKDAQMEKLNIEIAVLKSSEDLIQYLNSNYQIDERSTSSTPQSPLDFFNQKKGSALDLAVFASYVLQQKEYESGIIAYRYNSKDQNEVKSYSVAIFRDKDLPKYIVLTGQGIQAIHHGWSFTDLVQKEKERIGAEILEYAFFPPGSQNLETDDWIKINN